MAPLGLFTCGGLGLAPAYATVVPSPGPVYPHPIATTEHTMAPTPEGHRLAAPPRPQRLVSPVPLRVPPRTPMRSPPSAFASRAERQGCRPRTPRRIWSPATVPRFCAQRKRSQATMTRSFCEALTSFPVFRNAFYLAWWRRKRLTRVQGPCLLRNTVRSRYLRSSPRLPKTYLERSLASANSTVTV